MSPAPEPSRTPPFESAESTRDRRLKNAAAAVVLVLGTLLLFHPAVGYGFLNYDDGIYVYQNPGVLGGLSWAGLRYALASGDAGSWAPLTWLSYQADVSL